MKKYGFSAAVGVALFVFAAVTSLSDVNFPSEGVLTQIFMLLSDACLLPGAVLLALGGLMFVSGAGMFDIISYALTSLAGGGAGYYEYKCQRKRKKRNPAPTLFVGVGFLFLSMVFGLIYCLLI